MKGTNMLEKLTLGDIANLLDKFAVGSPNKKDSGTLEVGKAYLVRTVTHYYTGRLAAFDDVFLRFEDAAWIADTGRFFNAISKGDLDEIEPMPHGMSVPIGAIIDLSPWVHDLPKEQR